MGGGWIGEQIKNLKSEVHMDESEGATEDRIWGQGRTYLHLPSF